MKIGINGFGRVGRQVFRVAASIPSVIVTAINDPFLDAEQIAYLIKFDSTFGKYPGSVESRPGAVVVDGKVIKVTQFSDPATVPWAESRTVYVVESSGVFTTLERAALHLAGGAQRVIITAPSADAPMYIVGVNESKFRPENQVISAGSCTAVALAPVLRLLSDKIGINACLFTTIHAATASQRLVDGGAKEWRLGRAQLNNIIPTSTTGVKCINRLLPNLNGRVSGTAVRVPIQNVCYADVTLEFGQPIKKTALDQIFIDASNDAALGKVIGVTTDQVVSSDLVGDAHSAVYDLKAGIQVNESFHKIFLWYDNEHGYARRIVDLILYSANTW